MKVTVTRYATKKDSTLSIVHIDGRFICYMLEDGHRDVKVHGETRIPAGKYKMELRTDGGMNKDYLKKFGGEFHKGMLWLREVPNFSYVYHHIGNKVSNTNGCGLTGSTPSAITAKVDSVWGSTDAYERYYPTVRDAILENVEDVIAEYIDLG